MADSMMELLRKTDTQKLIRSVTSAESM